MPQFPKPKFAYAFDPVAEIARLQQHKQTRGIPAKARNRLLLATWNIANLLTGLFVSKAILKAAAYVIVARSRQQCFLW